MARQGGVRLIPQAHCKTAGTLRAGECPGERAAGENADLELGQKKRLKPERCRPAKEAGWRGACVGGRKGNCQHYLVLSPWEKQP